MPVAFGKLHEQAVGKLVAPFVVVNFRRDYLDGSSLIKFHDKFHRRAVVFETAERAPFL